MAQTNNLISVWCLICVVFLTAGCNLATVGALSGGSIGYALGRERGAMLGAGGGLLAGAIADTLLRRGEPVQQSEASPLPRQTRIFRSACESFSTEEEYRACQRGQARAEEQNRRERLYDAERYGYEIQRGRYRY
jgi:hypothetical protein